MGNVISVPKEEEEGIEKKQFKNFHKLIFRIVKDFPKLIQN